MLVYKAETKYRENVWERSKVRLVLNSFSQLTIHIVFISLCKLPFLYK